jgi:anti-anti-sigma regulatory factor
MTRLTAEATTAGPGSTVVLRLTGSLDLGSAAVLYDALTRCLPAEPPLIVVDLSALTDAAVDAIGAFGRVADQARAWPGSSLVLGGPVPTVAAMLARAQRRVPVFPTVADALAGQAGTRAGQAVAGPVGDRPAADEPTGPDRSVPDLVDPGHPAPHRPTPGRLTLTLGPEVSAASTARRLIDRTLAAWGLTVLRDPARLVMTELVSNAVRHARTALEISLAWQPDAIHLSVRDHNPAPPRPGGPVAPTVEGGRGLLVVDLLARAWGTTPTRDGKVVWASLARP